MSKPARAKTFKALEGEKRRKTPKTRKRVMDFADWDNRCFVLSQAWGQISAARDQVRYFGASKAADALSRALKSLDGGIRHAQRMRDQAEREMEISA